MVVVSPIIDFGQLRLGIRELDWPLPEVPISPRAKLFVASLEDVDRLLKGHDPSRSIAELKKHFENGDRCFAVSTSDARVIHKTHQPMVSMDA